MKKINDIKNKFNELSDKKILIMIFVLSLIIHAIPNFLFPSLTSLPTEFASLGLSSSLVGYNWSNMINSLQYYGNGFYVLFTPIMLIVKNPYVLHQLILLGVCALEAIPSIIVYKLMKENFKIDNRIYIIIVSFIVSFFDVMTTSVAVNEHPLKVILWLLIYILIRNAQKKESNLTKSTLIIVLLMVYSMLVHTRAILMIGCVVLAIVLYKLIYKIDLVNLKVFFVSLIPGIFVGKKCVKLITHLLWTAPAGSLKNTDGTISKLFSLLGNVLSKNGIKGFLNITLGQFFAANIYSMGMFMILLIITFLLIKEILFKKSNFFMKEESIAYIICIPAILLSIVALGIFSNKGAILSIEKDTGAKAYFYLRYFYFYFSPLAMSFAIFIYKNSKTILQYKLPIIVGYFLACMFIFTYIVPTTLTGPTLKLDYNHYLSPFCLRKYGQLLIPKDFFVVTALILIAYLVYFFLIKKKKLVIFMAILCIGSFYEYNYINIIFNLNKSKELYSYVDSYIEKINNDQTIEHNYDLYVCHYYASEVAQYEMPHARVYNGLVETINSESYAILDSSLYDAAKIEKYHISYYAQLDDNEYIYSNKKISNLMKEIDYLGQ